MLQKQEKEPVFIFVIAKHRKAQSLTTKTLLWLQRAWLGNSHHSSSTAPWENKLWSPNSHPKDPFLSHPIPAISGSTYMFSSLSQALKLFYHCILVLFSPTIP